MYSLISLRLKPMKKIYFFSFLFHLPILIYSQSDSTTTRLQRLEKEINGNLLSPSVSAILLPKGFVEVNIFNSILSSGTIFDENKKRQDAFSRSTYYFGLTQITYGLARKFNIGMDVTYTAARNDFDLNSNPLKVFGSSETDLFQQEKSVSSISLRARYLPTHNNKIVFQSAFLIPVATEKVANFIGQNRIGFNTQVLYNIRLSNKFNIFTQFGLNYLFKKNDSFLGQLSVPANAYFSYMVGNKFLPFVMLGHMSNFGKNYNNNFEWLNHFSSYGGGAQYQFSLRFSINAFFTNVFEGKNTPIWQNYNLGARIVI